MPEDSISSMFPIMKAPSKDSSRVRLAVIPSISVPRVRTTFGSALTFTPTRISPITVAELGPSIRIKSVGSLDTTLTVTVTAPDASLTSNITPRISRFSPSPVVGNRDGPVVIVLVVLRLPFHSSSEACREAVLTRCQRNQPCPNLCRLREGRSNRE